MYFDMLSSIYFSQAIMVGAVLVLIVFLSYVQGRGEQWSELILYYVAIFMVMIGLMILDSMFEGLNPKLSINIVLAGDSAAGPAWIRVLESLSAIAIGGAFIVGTFLLLRTALRNKSNRGDALRVVVAIAISCQVITDGIPSIATIFGRPGSKGIINILFILFLFMMFVACTLEPKQESEDDEYKEDDGTA